MAQSMKVLLKKKSKKRTSTKSMYIIKSKKDKKRLEPHYLKPALV
jgi:hypothetical protein